MPYDPESNPRFIGDEEETPEPDEGRIAELQHKVLWLVEGLAVFEEAGWAHVQATLQAEVAGLMHQLLGDEDSLAHIGRVRGQAIALTRVLQLPAIWQGELDRARAELASMTSSDSEDDSEDDEPDLP